MLQLACCLLQRVADAAVATEERLGSHTFNRTEAAEEVRVQQCSRDNLLMARLSKTDRLEPRSAHAPNAEKGGRGITVRTEMYRERISLSALHVGRGW